MREVWSSCSPEETRQLGRKVHEALGGQGLLLLHGDLGAGKTCFVQGLAGAMGLDEAVTSPTYSLLKTYGDPVQLVHADLYRLSDEDELLELGLEEWLDQEVLIAVEWPSRASGFWPGNEWHLELQSDPEAPDQRRILFWKGETPCV